MSICPHCTAKNEATATVCRSCGQPLQPATPAASAELPAWLQQLKPESAPAPARDEVLATAPVVFRPTTTPVTAAPADSAQPTAQTPARPAGGETAASKPAASAAVAPQPPPRPATPPAVAAPPAEKPATSQTETASLVTEEDLPSWLRAFSENESQKPASAPVSEGQSWLTSVAGAGDAEGGDKIAHSWQAPSQPAARRHTGAGSLFARVAESAPATGAPQVEHPIPVVRAPAAAAATGDRAPDTAMAATPAATPGESRARTPAPASRGGGSRVAVYAAIGVIVLLILLGLAAKLLGVF